MKKAVLVSVFLWATQIAGAVACRDFSSQEEAQKYHEEHGGNTRLDGDKDGDKDGEACECLPGGSAYGSPKCNR